jgi:hypothetical protein
MKRKPEPWYKKAYWKLWNIKESIVDFPHEIKYFYQRGKRGYCDRDVWNFHAYICKVISGATKELAENCMGCPSDVFKCKYPTEIYGDGNCDICKELYKECPACIEWSSILLEISDGFKEYGEGVIDGGILDELYKDRELDMNFKPVKDKDDLSECNITVTPDITKEERDTNYKKFKDADKHFKKVIGPKFIKHLSGMWD